MRASDRRPMEMRGGNGYIEEWIEPRLLRESHLGSTGGTSNIIALDVCGRRARPGASRPGAAAGGDDRGSACRSGGCAGERLGAALALIDRAAAATRRTCCAGRGNGPLSRHRRGAVPVEARSSRPVRRTWRPRDRPQLSARDPWRRPPADEAAADRVIDALVRHARAPDARLSSSRRHAGPQDPRGTSRDPCTVPQALFMIACAEGNASGWRCANTNQEQALT